MTSGGWRIAAASAIGTSHIKQGTVCQDSYVCRQFADRDGRQVLVLVASDGAGSASRSDEGSLCACQTIAEAVEVFLAQDNVVGDLDQNEVCQWIEMVQQAIAYKAEGAGAVPRDYACTLLVAIVGETDSAFVQVGDGAIVITDETGEWSWVHWPQRGDYANTTFFVTEPDTAERIAFDLIRAPVQDVGIFTDGIEPLVLHYASKTVHTPFFDQMIAPVRTSKADGVDAALSSGLEKYLASPRICERTDDDKTLVLASRRTVTAPQP